MVQVRVEVNIHWAIRIIGHLALTGTIPLEVGCHVEVGISGHWQAVEGYQSPCNTLIAVISWLMPRYYFFYLSSRSLIIDWHQASRTGARRADFQ